MSSHPMGHLGMKTNGDSQVHELIIHRQESSSAGGLLDRTAGSERGMKKHASREARRCALSLLYGALGGNVSQEWDNAPPFDPIRRMEKIST
jgi:hypothetical protein